MKKQKYTPVIGLEIHVELKTQSKMFCQCDADYFGKKPNTNTCPVCIGMPGALPVPNRTAVEWAIKIGQALNCVINKHSKFDRKHYFYPDLPKGYQISQYDEPLAIDGHLDIITTPSSLRSATPPYKGGESPNNDLLLTKEEYLPRRQAGPKGEVVKKIGITRVHLEEDTGKLTHAGDDTLVDFNRSSVPLVEIVTEPDFDNAEDVKIFLEELHTIIRYLDVSDANMEEGSMRMEPNISLSTIENYELRITNLPNYKVEVKNINSFNFAKKAIDFELIRQAEILDKGETPTQETRGYDDKKGITFSQRSKEEAQDYRYFPEPDIPPMIFDNDQLRMIKDELPELPSSKCARYVDDLKLRYDDAFLLTRNRAGAQYFEEVVAEVGSDRDLSPQAVANAIINKKISTDISIEEFAQKFIEINKPVEVDEKALQEAVEKVLASSASQIAQYKSGKTGLLGFFVGQVMKEMKGQADPQKVNEMLKKRIAQL